MKLPALPIISRTARADADPPSIVVALPDDPADRSLEIALPAGVMPRFVAAIAPAVGGGDDAGRALATARAPALSPDSVEGLLASAIGAAGGIGTARVVRTPAGLHSPEYWRIALTGANGAAVDVVRRAARGEAPAA